MTFKECFFFNFEIISKTSCVMICVLTCYFSDQNIHNVFTPFFITSFQPISNICNFWYIVYWEKSFELIFFKSKIMWETRNNCHFVRRLIKNVLYRKNFKKKNSTQFDLSLYFCIFMVNWHYSLFRILELHVYITWKTIFKKSMLIFIYTIFKTCIPQFC